MRFEFFNFSESIISKLNKISGLYLLFDQRHTLLYIGKAVDIEKRLKQHLHGTKESLRFRAEIKLFAVIRRSHIPITKSLYSYESRLIEDLKPVYNIKRKRPKEVKS